MINCVVHWYLITTIAGQVNDHYQMPLGRTGNTKGSFLFTKICCIRIGLSSLNSSHKKSFKSFRVATKVFNSVATQSCVCWLYICHDIDNFIQHCPKCQQLAVAPREPLTIATLPSHPREKVASNLFHLKNSTYLIVTDYFSIYPEVIQLKSTTPTSVIKALKSIFSHHWCLLSVWVILVHNLHPLPWKNLLLCMDLHWWYRTSALGHSSVDKNWTQPNNWPDPLACNYPKVLHCNNLGWPRA